MAPNLVLSECYACTWNEGSDLHIQFYPEAYRCALKPPTAPSKIDDKSPTDFVTKFLLLKEVSPEKVDKKDIESAAFNNFGAGSDTTSIGLCAVIYFLCLYPVTFAKLRKELDEAAKCGTCSEPVT